MRWYLSPNLTDFVKIFQEWTKLFNAKKMRLYDMYSQIYSGAPHINWIINFSSSISISLLEINSLLSKVKRVIRLTRQLFLYFFPGFINKTISRDKPVWRNWAEKGCNQYSTPTRPRPQTLDPCPYICAPLLSLPGPPIALTLSRSQKSAAQSDHIHDTKRDNLNLFN